MNILQIALGILTGIGGFLEVGAIATSTEAGARYHFQLIWALVLGTVCLIFLVEMTGRLAAVSHHAIADAVRERFGFPFSVVPRTLELIVNLMTLAAEIGGVALALKFVTGWPVRVTAIPIALLAWLLIWAGTLQFLENGTSLIGLVSICFIVAAWKLHPPMHDVLRGILPSLPQDDKAHYWFLAISIIGATIAPYMFHFYSSGAIEEKWTEKSLGTNRMTAVVGMAFGCTIAIGIVVVAAKVFAPAHIQLDQYEQGPLLLVSTLGHFAVPLFAATLGVCCFGAVVELSLGTAYMLAQTFGWNWAEDEKPHQEARFAATYTIMLLAGGLVLVTGIDPLKLTLYSMALTAAILPLIVVPFILLMNDDGYLRDHTNGPIGNFVVIATIVLSSVIALVTIPLEMMGGG
jgi:Mn2+/Fe2+ NRAMP family transporter